MLSLPFASPLTPWPPRLHLAPQILPTPLCSTRRRPVPPPPCSAVHNLAVALLSWRGEEAPLLDFLARARTPLGRPLYEPKYALGLARERGK